MMMEQQHTQQEQVSDEAGRLAYHPSDENTEEQQEEQTALPPAVARVVRLNRLYRQVQGSITALNGVFGLFFLWHLWKSGHTSDYSIYYYIWIFVFSMSALGLTSLQRWASRRLAQWDDLCMVGPLVDALAGSNARDLQQPLIRLLLRMRASDAANLSSGQRKRLYSVLKLSNSSFWEVNFHLAILKALEQVGDGQAIPIVERLAQSAKNGKIRKAAQDCLPFLQERAEQEHSRETLLRPAGAVDVPSDTLLRAAEGGNETDPQQLLRPGDDARRP